MEGEHEQLAEVLINELPFKTTFPPPTRMSPAQSDERVAEMKRRGGLAPCELVPSASACDETIATTGAGVVTGRSRAYIPYEADSNCDFSGASEQLPLALAIDGTGHDKGSDAAKHSENGRAILKEVEACIRECLDDVQLPQQLADKVLALLKALEASDDSRIHHISCTLSVAIKVEARMKAYALTFHWGDNVIFIANPKRGTLALINPPLNSDYGIGATHSVSSRKQGESLLPHSLCVRELEADDHIVCLTDGVWDHFVLSSADAAGAKKKQGPPELDETALLAVFEADEGEERNSNDDAVESIVGRLFEEARNRARAKMEAKEMREAELDDMSAFIIPPSTPALVLPNAAASHHNNKSDKKSCTLS